MMVGRSWSSKPWYWSQADSKFFGTKVWLDAWRVIARDFPPLHNGVDSVFVPMKWTAPSAVVALNQREA